MTYVYCALCTVLLQEPLRSLYTIPERYVMGLLATETAKNDNTGNYVELIDIQY